MKVELLRLTEDSFGLISNAYRICYKSQPKEGKEQEGKFIQACIKNGHTSPLEHASATFLVDGISRICSQQLERHRIASYTQESQRYVDSEFAGVVAPRSILDDTYAFQHYQGVIETCRAAYKNLIELGIKKEDARFVFPQAVETRLMVTMNFRSLRNFFDLRINPRAQWEIKKLAAIMLSKIMVSQPDLRFVFSDIFEKYQK